MNILVGAADIISAVEFDHSGDYLATGDYGGRVVLFERMEVSEKESNDFPDDSRPTPPTHPYDYRYLTEFQSHDPEFDYLKSLEIEEKINQVRWLRRWDSPSCHTLLTTNDKTIKLWKVYNRKVVSLVDFNLSGSSELNRAVSVQNSEEPMKMRTSPVTSPLSNRGRMAFEHQIRIPTVRSTSYELASKCRRVYSSAHAYHINSISLCADEEIFLSADDLRINTWHLDRPDVSFTIVDIKPDSMEELTEVITCATFHPTSAHLFAHGSSKGLIRLADMRASALCDRHAMMFDGSEKNESARDFFSEIVASVNDMKFIGPSGNYLVARDYMTLKIWDIRYEADPVYIHPVHDMIKPKLPQLYESDSIFDKFDCCASGDGTLLATGTYSNFFRVTPLAPSSSQDSILLEASRDPTRRRLSSPKFPNRIVGFGRTIPRTSSKNSLHRKLSGPRLEPPAITDFQSKIQHMSWHPEMPIIATAAQNSLYLYYGRDNKQDCF